MRYVPLVWLTLWLAGSFPATKASDMSGTQTEPTLVLVDFESPAGEDWIVINDGVMGGVSTSQMFRTDRGTGVFTGRLSLENNGGFVSTRTDAGHLDLSTWAGLEIRFRGDGRTYQLRLRTDEFFDGMSYRASFNTRRGDWITARLPFSAFLPTYRGRVLTEAPPLDPSQIRQVGLLLADKTPGSFSLEIDVIRTYGMKGDS